MNEPIKRLVAACKGNQSEAARLMKVDPTEVSRWMNDHHKAGKLRIEQAERLIAELEGEKDE